VWDLELALEQVLEHLLAESQTQERMANIELEM
jgi:hypothetical protein